MLRKVLVANRGEIAIRAFRAAHELGIASVAMYPSEDRRSLHRIKADESYEVGEAGHPVRAYLDPLLVVELACATGADAVYPGYGFMAENPELARECARAGIAFIGPPASVLALAGNKVRAREAARHCGVPVLAASGLITDPSAAVLAGDLEFPLFVKAAAGGGGRGVRLVTSASELRDAIASAMREAEGAFGDASVYIEQAIRNARHIEVQVLADAIGQVIHLFERDCSVQRRHQKVIELAPAPNLSADLRDRLCADAVRLATEIGYVNAGTVEFLVDDDTGAYVFIEINPRVQVEHTVTEETTDVDLVRCQMLIAGGATLAELGLTQDRVRQRGVALQCRITTEDPAAGFRPDTGRISGYRAAGGAGVRIDEASVYVGADISSYFDSLLLKVTARGQDLPTAIARARRTVGEVRIRGVCTNQAFLGAVLDDPDFRAGRARTDFVDQRPWLMTAGGSGDRATKLVRWIAEVSINRPNGPAPSGPDPRTKLPPHSVNDPSNGSRQQLLELGPVEFASWLRASRALAVTDTTLRDAHQSLLATRMRTFDMAAVAPHIATLLPELLSLEVWGGATFDTAVRFLHEDPWERLTRLRSAVPNICLQMLLRGRNLLGYEPYPDGAVRAFVAEARAAGIDIFRIFDALNNVEPMRAAITAATEAGAIAEGTLCYTGDLSDPNETVYTLDYYLRIADELIGAGAHILAVKDMAGLLRAPAARRLISRLRSEFDAPVHLHTHDTAGGQLATYLAALEVGVDAIDGAASPLAGTTSQPSLAAIVSATDYTEHATGLSLDALLVLEPYWEAVRNLYAPFETGRRSPTGRVYRHEIPGGQLSNLQQQAAALGLVGRFEEVENAYIRANELLGGIVKVTPTSKVIGDLALFALSSSIDWSELQAEPARFDLPDSVLRFLDGELGHPATGLPEPFATDALARRRRARAPRLGEAQGLPAPGRDRQQALSEMMFPAPAREQLDTGRRYGDVSLIPTRAFLYGLEKGEETTVDLAPGVQLAVGLEAIGAPDERGMCSVVATVNGQLRLLDVRDESVRVSNPPSRLADPSNPDHVAAPLTGVVTTLVSVGDELAAGAPVAILEAMKMESTVTSPRAGHVERVVAESGQRLERGDLLITLACV